MSIESLYEIYQHSYHVTINSLEVINGSIFFAVGRKGKNGVHNGCKYADNAIESGAAAVVVNDKDLFSKHKADQRWFFFEDCEFALQELSKS